MACKVNGRPSTKAAHTVAHNYGQRTDKKMPTKHKTRRPSPGAAHTLVYEYRQQESVQAPKDRIDPYLNSYAYERSNHIVLTCGNCKEPFASELYAEKIYPLGGYVWEGQVNMEEQSEVLRRQQGYMCGLCGDKRVDRPDYAALDHWFRVVMGTVVWIETLDLQYYQNT